MSDSRQPTADSRDLPHVRKPAEVGHDVSIYWAARSRHVATFFNGLLDEACNAFDLNANRWEPTAMARRTVDPSESLRDAARSMRDVDEGTSCSQTSFRVGGKAFLYVGEQGGRFKAMFKLSDSIAQAERMAGDSPDDVQVGKHGWVTARFSAEKPLAARVWKKWLNESYGLAAAG